MEDNTPYRITPEMAALVEEARMCRDYADAEPKRTVRIEIPGRKAALESTRLLAPEELKDAVRGLIKKYNGEENV